MNHYFFRRAFTGIIALLSAGGVGAQDTPSVFTDPVTLKAAFQMALDQDPQLNVWQSFIEAADGQIEQAQTRPNPVVGVELENVVGTGPFQGVDGLEFTLSISQVLETAEKRTRRTELAQRERALTDWDIEARVVELESQVRTAFVDILIAQEVVTLRRAQLQLAESSMIETDKLVAAARANTVEGTRAQLSVRQQSFALSSAERDLTGARDRLAARWGMIPSPTFEVEGEIKLEPVPVFSELLAILNNTSAVARYGAETEAREANVALEEAMAKPDIEVFGGARYFNESSGDAALVVGLQIPWPLSDRNQGNIRSAQARLRAVEHQRATIVRELSVELSKSHRQLINATEEFNALTQDLRPAAEQTMADTESGYERGQFTLLSVLESRGVLFEIREAELAATASYASALARIETLTRPTSIGL